MTAGFADIRMKTEHLGGMNASKYYSSFRLYPYSLPLPLCIKRVGKKYKGRGKGWLILLLLYQETVRHRTYCTVVHSIISKVHVSRNFTVKILRVETAALY